MDEPTVQAPAAAQETPPTPAPAAEPASEPTPVETPAAVPAKEPSKALSPTEAYEARVRAARAEQPKAAPKEAVAEVTPPETPAEVVPEPEVAPPAAPTEPEREKILPNRIATSQFNDTEKAAIALLRELRQDDPNATLKDAYVIVEQRQAEAKATEPEPTPDPVEQAEASLSELRAKRRELAQSGTLYEADLDNLNVEIENEIQKLAELKAERRIEGKKAAEEQNAAVNSVFEQSKARAIEAFPDLGDENSAHSAAVRAYIEEIRAPGHPNAALLEAVDAPYIVAMLTAKTLPKATAQPAPAKPTPVPQPKPKIQPASGAQPATPQPTQKPANWDKMSFDERYAYNVKSRRATAGVALGL